MRTVLIAFSIAVLAACNRGSSTGEPNGPLTTPNSTGDNVEAVAPQDNGTAAAPEENVAALPPEERSEKAGELPPPNEGLRFVGLWAADEKSCESGAWKFTDNKLTTPAGSVCTFKQVTQVPGGYDIQATCTAERPAAPDTLEIRFAESAKAMLFNSKTIADSGLIFCGRDV